MQLNTKKIVNTFGIFMALIGINALFSMESSHYKKGIQLQQLDDDQLFICGDNKPSIDNKINDEIKEIMIVFNDSSTLGDLSFRIIHNQLKNVSILTMKNFLWSKIHECKITTTKEDYFIYFLENNLEFFSKEQIKHKKSYKDFKTLDTILIQIYYAIKLKKLQNNPQNK